MEVSWRLEHTNMLKLIFKLKLKLLHFVLFLTRGQLIEGQQYYALWLMMHWKGTSFSIFDFTKCWSLSTNIIQTQVNSILIWVSTRLKYLFNEIHLLERGNTFNALIVDNLFPRMLVEPYCLCIIWWLWLGYFIISRIHDYSFSRSWVICLIVKYSSSVNWAEPKL